MIAIEIRILLVLSAFTRSGRRILPPAIVAIAVLFTNTIVAKAQGCVPLPPYANEADRIGVNVTNDYGKTFWDYDTDSISAGWFLDYGANPSFSRPIETASSNDLVSVTALAYAPVIRVADFDGSYDQMVRTLTKKSPGMLWIIGNEPDRHMQDAMPPDEYAVVYHNAYESIKRNDPTANVAIAPVVEPTPLRRKYYEMVLEEYLRLYGEKLPVDVWTTHLFILRESNEWGAGIATGLDDYADLGILYEVPDHGNVEILKGLIRDFRTWMAEQGYQNTPLLITEYGILFAPDYDAGNGRQYDSEYVRGFMKDSFDFFRSERSASTGYPGDDYRLVQAWSWFGLNNYIYSYPDREYGFNGNLFDHDTAVLTDIGKAFAEYTGQLTSNYVDYAFRRSSAPSTFEAANATGNMFTVDLSVYNRGNLRAPNSRINVWLGYPEDNGKLLQSYDIDMELGERCRGVYDTSIAVDLPELDAGLYSLVIDVDGAATSVYDPLPTNDRIVVTLAVGVGINGITTYLPTVTN